MTDTESNIFRENKMSRSLTTITLFKGLSAEERSALERECKWRHYQAGEHLFSRGSLGTEVFFLIDGEVRIIGVATSGQEFTLANVEAGESVGEMAAIDALPRSASVVASQKSLVAILNGDRFVDVLKRHGEIGVALLKRLSSMVRIGDDSVTELRVHNERMETELDIARKIQMSMIPLIFPPFPEHDEFAVFAVLEPAREVGGDFYDFFFIDEDRFCFCIGDVSGKGVPSALYMAVAKTLIKSRATDDFSTASILTHVNDELSADNKEWMFVTLFIAIVNILSGDVVYTNAGHNPSYIRRRNGTLVCLDERHGPVIGIKEGMVYGENGVKMDPGDIFLLYTDGVTEAMDADHNMYSNERLLKLLETMEADTVENVVKEIVTSVETFEDGVAQTDDVTVMAFQLHSSSKASTPPT